MATSPNLGINHLTQAQNQKHVTVNDGFDQLDGAVSQEGTGSGFDFPSDADFTPTALDVQGVFSIVVAGTTTVSRDYNLPITSHIWLVENATVGGFDVVFQVVGGAGDSVTIANGDRKFIWSDGVDVAFATGESPYELGGFIPGGPSPTTMIYKVVVARTVSFVDDFVSSQGHAETPPSGGDVSFDIQHNSVSIGTMTFADGVGTATFVSTGPDILIAGDTFAIHTPSDLQSMQDVSFMFAGQR